MKCRVCCWKDLKIKNSDALFQLQTGNICLRCSAKFTDVSFTFWTVKPFSQQADTVGKHEHTWSPSGSSLSSFTLHSVQPSDVGDSSCCGVKPWSDNRFFHYKNVYIKPPAPLTPCWCFSAVAKNATSNTFEFLLFSPTFCGENCVRFICIYICSRVQFRRNNVDPPFFMHNIEA